MEEKSVQDIVESILYGDCADPDVLSNRAALYDYNLHKPHRVFIVQSRREAVANIANLDTEQKRWRKVRLKTYQQIVQDAFRRAGKRVLSTNPFRPHGSADSGRWRHAGNVYSASVMSSRLPQRLTTPCEPVLRDAPVLDDAVEVLRVGPLGAAELLDADGAGVSCCGATPCPLAFSRRGWLPPPLRPPPPLSVGPLGPLRLPAPPGSPFKRRSFPSLPEGFGDAPPRNALGPYFSDCPRICSVAVSPIELMPAPIQRSTVSGKLCDSPKIMYITGSSTKP